jgi:serine/threonine protein kinase
MAKNAKDVAAGLNKGQKEVSQTTSTIKSSDLTYELEGDTPKILGKGGCGQVLLGTYRQVEGHVAIKQLFINNAPEDMVKEFENEASVMGKLRSDYLVQFYGCCLSPKYCLIMEYMPEGSLFNLLRSKKPIDWNIRYQISMQMSLGLEFLHENNILHRDIKSLNVLLKNGKAKLSDFGLSRIKKESNSTQGGSVGTVQWMAPELFERKPKYTQKSDIYSLGMTFWEIASRQIPFADASSNGIISAWVEQGEREEIPEDCPKKFKSLIFSCWKGEGAKAIDKPWQGKPSDRPTARQITDYLRSNEEDFEAFIAPKAAASQAASQPHYLDNLNSGIVDSKISSDNKPVISFTPPPKPSAPPISPKPAVVPPIPPKPAVVPQTPQYSAISATAQPAVNVIVKPKVDAKELQEFLNHVAWGRQDEAEAMLKINKDLALAAGDVTDHAKRTFKNITGFQYAVWALDWKMWTMLLPYLSPEAAKEQAEGFKTGSWTKEHAEHANWKNLTDALQVYIDNYQPWTYAQRAKHWVEQVGGAQFKLPMHVLQEYNNPNRPFEPCPKFDVQYPLQRSLPDWLDKGIKAAKFDFGVFRYTVPWGVVGRAVAEVVVVVSGLVGPDRSALIRLYDTRIQQRGVLVSQLLGSNLVQAQKPGK